MNAVSQKEAAALELVPAAKAASAPTPGPLPTSLAANFMLTLQERGAGLEQIEKMMDLLERNERHEAEKAYNEALAAFKAKDIRIVKHKLVDFLNNKGGRTSYKHAELDDVVRAVGPELSAHGFAWSWKTSQAGRDITVVCTLRHRLGHAETVQLTAQPDETGGKNAIQAIISTTTYLQRHTLKQITGVAEAGEDDDGQGGAAAPLSKLAQGWVDYIISVRGTDEFDKGCRDGRAALTRDRAGLIAFNAATRSTA
ncbi:ERF family protein [Delftia acidovorans]|uniref:ERF family protein n=1 Tax=Delftia acidovorans TaxID=80866 RepID=UPI001EE067C5|nr:ERF family protein [Delftia acidovorans]MCG3784797.1 ERF family protein [Delftia acidovorans]